MYNRLLWIFNWFWYVIFLRDCVCNSQIETEMIKVMSTAPGIISFENLQYKHWCDQQTFTSMTMCIEDDSTKVLQIYKYLTRALPVRLNTHHCFNTIKSRKIFWNPYSHDCMPWFQNNLINTRGIIVSDKTTLMKRKWDDLITIQKSWISSLHINHAILFEQHSTNFCQRLVTRLTIYLCVCDTLFYNKTGRLWYNENAAHKMSFTLSYS